MKNKILLIALATLMTLAACGNRDMWDTNYTFDKAIVSLHNGEVIEVDIKQWCTYEGEQIQIIAEDGTIYLTSSFNCTLIRNADSDEWTFPERETN